MGKRGRISTASLMIAQPRPVEAVERQRAPHDLTDEETEVWVAIVNSEPADKFTPSTAPLLAQLCRHVVAARRISELIERAGSNPDLPISTYASLHAMQCNESRTMAALLTKMRLTQQATTNHRGNKLPSVSRKPWE